MSTDAETLEIVRRALASHQPARVVVMLDGAESREIVVTKSRKRWAAVLKCLAGLDWDAIELRDKAGKVLDVISTVEADEAPADGPDRASSGRELGTEATLRLMLAAQREALTYRSKESDAALEACVSVMREMTSAVTALSAMHRAALQAAQQAPDDGGGLMSEGLLAQLAPLLLARATGGAPKGPSNGGS